MPGPDLGLRAPEGTPLYVHLPFCVVKCTYCDFFSVVAEGQDVEGALEDLAAEIEARAPHHPRTVFLGGGTPSLLSVEQLTRLFEALERATGFRASSRETTVECNPESLDPEKAQALRELGATRLTVGVQSLDPRLLELFARPHTAEQGLAAVATARAAGFPQVGLDLIYAAPGQELGPWLDELDRALALGPDHVSAYSLAFEEETPLTRRLARGELRPLSEDTAIAFFETTRAHLAARGFPAYEISNFAPPGKECLHNLGYWANGPYVGVGPSAVSHVGGTRWGSPRSLAAWRAAVRGPGRSAAWTETLAPRERLGETWWLGLRTTAGVDPAEARATAGWDAPEDPAEALADALVAEERLVHVGGRVRMHPRSWVLADAIAARFLAHGSDGAVNSAGRAAARE